MRTSNYISKETKNDNVKTFAIVGMGLTGTSLFCQLVEKLITSENKSVKYRIFVFDKSAELFAAGLPYQRNCPDIWTLNNSARNLKLMSNGTDMATWMQDNKSQWQAEFHNINEEYVPRALVGLYLKSQYQSYKEKAELHGIIVDDNLTEVVDMSITNENMWKLQTKNNKQHIANYVFLCFGHLPSNHFLHLKSKPNYFDAVDFKKIACIPQNAPVHILGGQATFVDVALWLAYDHEHTGPIYTITRNPPIITTKGNKEENDKISIEVEELKSNLKTSYSSNSLSLVDAKLLFWGAYTKAAKNPNDIIDINNLPRTRAALTYQLAKIEKVQLADNKIGNIDELRNFILTLYMSKCYAELCSKLKEEALVEFNKQFYSFIFAYLTGITPLTTRLLLALYDREQIYERDGLTNILYKDDKQKFIFNFEDGNQIEAEYLIDASGLGYDLSKCDDDFPLLKNLVQNGMLVPKKLGGIMLSDCGQAFTRENQLQTNLFCIGPVATYGHKFPTPYASFIAIEAIEKALTTISTNEFVAEEKNIRKITMC